MLPSDVLGTSIFNRATNQFEFQKGPIFTSILLADEINRATPRTQAALLEAMGEGRVTTDGHTYQLAPDFLSWQLRTRLIMQGLTRFLKHSWTGSCFASHLATQMLTRKKFAANA